MRVGHRGCGCEGVAASLPSDDEDDRDDRDDGAAEVGVQEGAGVSAGVSAGTRRAAITGEACT